MSIAPPFERWQELSGRDARLDHLRTFVLADLVSALIGFLAMVVVYLVSARSPYLLLGAAIVALAACGLGWALHKVRTGDAVAGVRWVAWTNWVVAPAATAICTFSWPILVVASLMPAVLVAPYLPRSAVVRYVVVSLLVSVLVSILGLLQDFSGLSDELSLNLRHAVLIAFIPFLSALVAISAFHSSSRFQFLLEQVRESRTRVVETADRERRRFERDIHDGAQQRLVALNLLTAKARGNCREDPDEAMAILDSVSREIQATHRELRELAHGIYPTVLTEHGLAAALESVVQRVENDVVLGFGRVGRLGADVEAAVYFCCVEAVQNASRHAGPAAVIWLRVDRDRRSELAFDVTDNGRGIEPGAMLAGRGLDNMRDRVEAAGGNFTIATWPGSGTRVGGRIPLEPQR